MDALVKYIVENLVSNKEAVKVSTENESENTIIIHVQVAKEDMGKVIGKGGKVAQSIRSIVKSASSMEESKNRYFVKFEE
ncbi:MAG: KH domain-containing protein [Clostridiales bacterium]|nr:KH domain-containing protein [Candidatus Apopatousia equi]